MFIEYKFKEDIDVVFTIWLPYTVVYCCTASRLLSMEQYGKVIGDYVDSPQPVKVFFHLLLTCLFIREKSRRNRLPSKCCWMFPRSIHQWDVMYQRVCRQDVTLRDNEWYANYWCQHDAHTILLQGICNHDKKFLSVCVLGPRGTHDAMPLRKSSFHMKHMDYEIIHESRLLIEGSQLKPYSVGDSTYPLLQHPTTL